MTKGARTTPLRHPGGVSEDDGVFADLPSAPPPPSADEAGFDDESTRADFTFERTLSEEMPPDEERPQAPPARAPSRAAPLPAPPSAPARRPSAEASGPRPVAPKAAVPLELDDGDNLATMMLPAGGLDVGKRPPSGPPPFIQPQRSATPPTAARAVSMGAARSSASAEASATKIPASPAMSPSPARAAHVPAAPVSGPAPIASSFASPTSSGLGFTDLPPAADDDFGSVLVDTPLPEVPNRRRRMRVMAATLAAVVVAAAGGAAYRLRPVDDDTQGLPPVLVSSSGDQGGTTAPPAPMEATGRAAETPPTEAVGGAAAAQEVSIELVSTPAGASVSVLGEPTERELCTTPCTHAFPAEPSSVELRFKLKGHGDVRRTIELAAQGRVEVALKARAARPAGTTSQKKPADTGLLNPF